MVMVGIFMLVMFIGCGQCLWHECYFQLIGPGVNAVQIGLRATLYFHLQAQWKEDLRWNTKDVWASDTVWGTLAAMSWTERLTSKYHSHLPFCKVWLQLSEFFLPLPINFSFTRDPCCLDATLIQAQSHFPDQIHLFGLCFDQGCDVILNKVILVKSKLSIYGEINGE